MVGTRNTLSLSLLCGLLSVLVNGCHRPWHGGLLPGHGAPPSPELGEPQAGRDWTVPGMGMEFAWVPTMAGWVGRYEVTNSEYRRFRPDHDSGRFEGHALNGDRQPAVEVNFSDACAYAAWLSQRERDAGRLPEGFSYRLPTRDEWTAFARCGDARTYPWGNDWPPRYGNFVDRTAKRTFVDWSVIEGYDDGYAVTCSVQASGQNDWGLCGVAGNVWECTLRPDRSGFDAWRGGAWRFINLAFLRCDFRFAGDGVLRDNYFGFRLVLAR